MATESNPSVDEFTVLRAEYADWLMTRRRGETQQEWAKAHGLSEFTVVRWKRHPEVVQLLSEWRTRVKSEFGLVAANMMRLAMGDGPQAVPAARLLADVLGETKNEIDLNVSAPFMDLQKKLVDIRRQSIDVVN